MKFFLIILIFFSNSEIISAFTLDDELKDQLDHIFLYGENYQLEKTKEKVHILRAKPQRIDWKKQLLFSYPFAYHLSFFQQQKGLGVGYDKKEESFLFLLSYLKNYEKEFFNFHPLKSFYQFSLHYYLRSKKIQLNLTPLLLSWKKVSLGFGITKEVLSLKEKISWNSSDLSPQWQMKGMIFYLF